MNRSCCNRDGSESYFTSRYESLDSRLAICLLKAERRHRKRGVSLTFQLVAFAKDFKWHHCRESKDIPHRKPAGYSFNTNECERMTELTSPRRAAEPFIRNKPVDYQRSSGAGVILTFSYWGKNVLTWIFEVNVCVHFKSRLDVMKKNETWRQRAEAAETQRADSSSYWGLTQCERLRTSINRACGWWGEHTQTHTQLKFPCSSHILMSTCWSKLDTVKHSWTERSDAFVHLQYDEVFWSVWLKCKFLTVENFESVSFAGLPVDFRWSDGDREQACVLHPEGSFESEVWLFDFCLWNKWQGNNLTNI